MDEMTVPHARRRAFSLMELLAVMAIIGIMAVLVTPAVSSLMQSSSLNKAGLMISDQFALARQEAVSKSRDTEVRFFFLTNGLSSGWRGVQLWRVEQTPLGPVSSPSARLTVIPDGTQLSMDLSPLLKFAPHTGSAALPGHGSTTYRSFRFRADGSLENSVGTNSYVTVVRGEDSSPNYYTIQLNPQTGKIGIFRP